MAEVITAPSQLLSARTILLLWTVITTAVAAVASSYEREEFSARAGVYLPQFVSVPGGHTVKKGGTIILPCIIQDLADMNVMWKRPSPSDPSDELVLTLGNQVVRDSERLRLLDGYNLQISRARPADAAVYTCSVALTDRDLEQTQTLDVQYGPFIRLIPESGQIIVDQGQNASLECRARGNPKPRVRWRRKAPGTLASVDLRRGERLHLTRVARADGGLYECVAENSVGDLVTASIDLQVLYKPETEVERSTVHTGEGFKAQLVCFVHADPIAEVKWSRAGSRIDSGRVTLTSDVVTGTRHVLTINEVRPEDLDTYTCTATNTLGVSRSRVVVSGVADKVQVVSPPMDGDAESYDLAWKVKSYSSVTEYKIAYRKAKINSTSESAGRWKEVLVPTTGRVPHNQIHFQQQVTLRGLTPATAYDLHIQAKNKHGWSRVSDTFHFSTIGRALESRSLTNVGSRITFYFHLFFILAGVVLRGAG